MTTVAGDLLSCWSKEAGCHGQCRYRAGAVGGWGDGKRGTAPWALQQWHLQRCLVTLRALLLVLAGCGEEHRWSWGCWAPGWVLRMGQVLSSFSPPSSFCRQRVSVTGLKTDTQILMLNLQGWIRSSIKSKFFHHQPRVELLCSVWAMEPVLGYGQCAGLPPLPMRVWDCRFLRDTPWITTGW